MHPTDCRRTWASEMPRILTLCLLRLGPSSGSWAVKGLAQSERSARVEARQASLLESSLTAQRLVLGAPVFLCAFKESSELEVWVQYSNECRRFKAYFAPLLCR